MDFVPLASFDECCRLIDRGQRHQPALQAASILQDNLKKSNKEDDLQQVAETLSQSSIGVQQSELREADVAASADEHPCEWDDWEEWADCSKSCGPGVRHRKKEILEPASDSYRPCDISQAQESEDCNLKSCDEYTCFAYKCSAYHRKREKPPAKTISCGDQKCTDWLCCEKVCSSHTCGSGWKDSTTKLHRACRDNTCTDEDCCDKESFIENMEDVLDEEEKSLENEEKQLVKHVNKDFNALIR